MAILLSSLRNILYFHLNIFFLIQFRIPWWDYMTREMGQLNPCNPFADIGLFGPVRFQVPFQCTLQTTSLITILSCFSLSLIFRLHPVAWPSWEHLCTTMWMWRFLSRTGSIWRLCIYFQMCIIVWVFHFSDPVVAFWTWCCTVVKMGKKALRESYLFVMIMAFH